ncbi:MAG: helix-turn-helix domain-containing protein [Acidimicrobiia bacterium]|nr:MAG: helix-turn-helix domain-containing protein [Acidimicrobiia bacterium]
MSLVDVAEAAQQLGVSPRRVRQMLADELVPAVRIGRAWAVEQRHVDHLKNHRASAGRPWSPSSAWAALAAADGREHSLSSVDRSRARRRLGRAGLVGIAERLAARADSRRFYGHPSVLERLGNAPDVVRSGVSAAKEHGADLLAWGFLEAYVPRSAADGIISKYALDEDAERANIVLRIVEDSAWPFAPGERFAPRAVVAIDLLESGDERSRRSGLALARQSP